LDRWNRIVKEAIQQSGTTTYPEIKEPVQFSELKNASSGLKLFFHQKPLEKNTLFIYLQIVHKQVKLNEINILIGPEGGFTDKEITDLYSYGFKPVYLVKEVLRAETAALYAIASIKTLLLELKYQEEI
jgi:16S rRNA (uracil1498-N3)-methyltransferase